MWQTVCDYIEQVRKDGLSREDFARGQRVMYAEFVKEFDSVEAIANNLLAAVFDGYCLFDYATLLSEVTFEEVCRLFETQFCREAATVSAVYPQK